MNILVTGGAGFIGSHLVDALVENNHKILVIDNLFRGKKENLKKHINSGKIEFQIADIRNFSSINQFFKNIDIVYHLAAQSNVMGAIQDIDYSFEANVIGTFNVLKASNKAGVKKFIFSSSRESYGESQNIPVNENHPLKAKNSYGVSKLAGEKYCLLFKKMFGLNVNILRLANVYGERDFDRVIPIFLENANKNQDIKIYGGKQVIDFVSIELVRDILFLYTTEFNNENPANVGSGKGTTLFELANRIMKLSDSKSKIVVEPAREQEVVKFVADVSYLKSLTDYNPPVDPLYYLKKLI